LFKAASLAVNEWCKEQGFVPGIVEVMHTFGSSLNFHPHIHMLLTEGGGLKDNPEVWQQCHFFPEKVLKARFKYFLVRALREFMAERVKAKLFNIPRELKALWQRKYETESFYEITKIIYGFIWYVYIGEKLYNARFTTRYIGRYAKRPCLSETKILYYSFKEQIVRFSYRDKISRSDITLTLSVDDFLKRLVRHIPEKNFRMIRYSGLYANRVRKEMATLLWAHISYLFGVVNLAYEDSDIAASFRTRMMRFTGIDPLLCPNCKKQMILASVTYRTRDGPLKTVSYL
jgi:hypothetical protein